MGGELGRVMPASVLIDQSVSDQMVEVRVKVEVFTKRMEGEESGGVTGGQISW